MKLLTQKETITISGASNKCCINKDGIPFFLGYYSPKTCREIANKMKREVISCASNDQEKKHIQFQIPKMDNILYNTK